MANKHLHRHAHFSKDKQTWWYETSKGIEVLTDSCIGDVLIIRWKTIRASLARKDQTDAN